MAKPMEVSEHDHFSRIGTVLDYIGMLPGYRDNNLTEQQRKRMFFKTHPLDTQKEKEKRNRQGRGFGQGFSEGEKCRRRPNGNRTWEQCYFNPKNQQWAPYPQYIGSNNSSYSGNSNMSVQFGGQFGGRGNGVGRGSNESNYTQAWGQNNYHRDAFCNITARPSAAEKTLGPKAAEKIPGPSAPILSIFCMIDNGNSEDEDPSDRRLRDRRTPRIALCWHCQSSFIYLFNSGNKHALLDCCGVDHKVFRDLLDLFQPAKATRCLGLVLFWFRTRGSVARISLMAFGLTSPVMIVLPNKEEMEDYISAIGAKYPALHEKRVWGAANGLKLKIQHSNNCTIANYGVYDQMQEMFDEYGAMLTVNATFKVRLTNYLIQSLQSNQVGAEALVLNREATLFRHLSELLLEDFGDQKVILNVMMLLYNYQTSTVGHNQILNVFMHKKDGYFSYATKPTEDATGMFE
eukprot:jgi/Psemu1/23598/gm1.23598_g